MRITLWSVVSHALGLTYLFPKSTLFNPEAMGGWERDSVREVDVVQGSFFLIRRALWDDLGGFDAKYFMYGEEADLCLRARERGARPIFTPDAEIVHLAGAASATQGHKKTLLFQGRVTLMRDYWPAWKVPLGLAALRLGTAVRYGLTSFLRTLAPRRFSGSADAWALIWKERKTWLGGY